MNKIYALGAEETVEFVYGSVKWYIKPLPYGIKKAIKNNSVKYANKIQMDVDLSDLSMMAVKYGLVNWDGLEFKDGRKAECKKEKDKDGLDCLSQETLEMIYRTSAFEPISICCIDNDLIPDWMDKAVIWDNGKNLSPPELGEDKKKL